MAFQLALQLYPQQPMDNFDSFIQAIINDKTLRIEATRKSFLIFCAVYFPKHLKYPLADFQKEMIDNAQDKTLNNMIVVAFRGSGKSTIMNLMYTLWSVMGVHDMRNICIVSRTQDQARLHFQNIKDELECNQLLKSDLGPFREDTLPAIWNASALTLTHFGARITAMSTDQSVRGMKHGANRPDLIIADDLEDIKSARSPVERDHTYSFFKSELILGGASDTRVIVLGNLLHEDSLIMRLKKEVEIGDLGGHYYEYPFLDENDKCLWPEKFVDDNAVEAERRRVGNPTIWQREMMLKIVPDDSQVIAPSYLKYHDNSFPVMFEGRKYRHTIIGVDLAFTISSTADYTAIVVGDVYGGQGMDDKMLIKPFPINERMEGPDSEMAIMRVIDNIQGDRQRTLKTAFVEDVGSQKSCVQKLQRKYGKQKVIGITPKGDKTVRLENTVFPIQEGRILFPPKDAEKLISQLTGFPADKHDDLVDAFSLLANQFLDTPRHNPIGCATVSFFGSIEKPWWNSLNSDAQNLELKKQYYLDLQRKHNNGEN